MLNILQIDPCQNWQRVFTLCPPNISRCSAWRRTSTRFASVLCKRWWEAGRGRLSIWSAFHGTEMGALSTASSSWTAKASRIDPTKSHGTMLSSQQPLPGLRLLTSPSWSLSGSNTKAPSQFFTGSPVNRSRSIALYPATNVRVRSKPYLKRQMLSFWISGM